MKHKSVLLQEVVSVLDPKQGEVFIDVTIGFGGHAQAMLERISPEGKLLGIDQDKEALDWLGANLKQKYPNLMLQKANFSEVGKVSRENGLDSANGILADIGVSSYQLDESARGFSIKSEGPLDMRMDKEDSLTAEKVVNSYSEHDLVDIFSKYGEERLSKSVAREIVLRRSQKLFQTTLELTELIKGVYRKKGLESTRVHPATRVFQALRIEVNNELVNLKIFLPQAISLLAPGGRLAVITFHSLEDRIVKDFFLHEAKECICPSEYPVCKCDHKKSVKIITKKPILPSSKEVENNPRARSAKMRVAEKIS